METLKIIKLNNRKLFLKLIPKKTDIIYGNSFTNPLNKDFYEPIKNLKK